MALAYVHSCGVLHTDVKPQNVLLSYTTPPGRDSGLTLNAGAGPVQVEYSARLADFGSALLLPPFTASSPTDGLGLGTPGYTAPELLLPPGSCSFSYSADVFSLGVVLGVLLFGREPYARLVGRGRGRLEMMRWAKKGGYWAYEEGVRLASVGELGQPRGEDEAGEEERVPRLGRNDLLELLANDGTERQEEELEEREDVVWPSPPELKLDPSSSEDSLTPGAANVEERNIPELVLSRVPHHLSGNPMVPLGVKEPIPLPSPPNSPPKSAANATTAHAHTRTRTSLHTPTTHSSQGVLSPPPPLTSPATPSAPYADGSPPIFFLGPSTLTGQPERAPDALVSLVKRMCSPNSEGRPEMDEVVSVLGALREAYCLV
ncbi:kinase-like protein [Dacryopinax primogenitus]|uniref:Kinase-like protein n=1 Tax=Dacryopinax primogenitus (strain DJM 731) TaxID=1858805 RepID=M5GGW2_DACPD|nr:kinase-like protein [Dacryopinax primogenitus]EJU06183.1 kinase-like protein [Dacryopinax primogenitus]